jgi:hypothetical protein
MHVYVRVRKVKALRRCLLKRLALVYDDDDDA